MARLGITNPDDLPEEHKPKQTAKRRSLGMTLTQKEAEKVARRSGVRRGSTSARRTSAAPAGTGPKSVTPVNQRPYSLGSGPRYSDTPALCDARPYGDTHPAHGAHDQQMHSEHSSITPSAIGGVAGGGNLDPELMGMDDGRPVYRETMSPPKDGRPPILGYYGGEVYYEDGDYTIEELALERENQIAMDAYVNDSD